MGIDALISTVAFLAVLIAVRGKTWDEARGKSWRAITLTGWLSLVLGAATLGLSILRSHQESNAKTQAAAVAATEILADLAPQATFYRILLLNEDIDPTSLRRELAEFQGFLESKVNRNVTALPLTARQAAENALSAQKQLLVLINNRNSFSEAELRNKIEACFTKTIAFGDELLAATGNNDGMMSTAVVSTTGAVTWHPTRLPQRRQPDEK